MQFMKMVSGASNKENLRFPLNPSLFYYSKEASFILLTRVKK